jgi:hypothetical protein
MARERPLCQNRWIKRLTFVERASSRRIKIINGLWKTKCVQARLLDPRTCQSQPKSHLKSVTYRKSLRNYPLDIPAGLSANSESVGKATSLWLVAWCYVRRVQHGLYHLLGCGNGRITAGYRHPHARSVSVTTSIELILLEHFAETVSSGSSLWNSYRSASIWDHLPFICVFDAQRPYASSPAPLVAAYQPWASPCRVAGRLRVRIAGCESACRGVAFTPLSRSALFPASCIRKQGWP